MKITMMKYLTISMFVTFAAFTAMVYSSSAVAGDHSMQTNLSSIADLMSKWSKQLSSGKVEPMAQEKMGEMMSNMSQVLKEMAGPGVSDMSMDHHNKIETMKKDWDPFDTSDKM